MARKYNYNDNYFENIDTEEKAYWLGFIAADGSIVNNNRALEITKIKLQTKNKMSVWNKVGINQIRIILSYLYDNCTTYLDRKYVYARELLPS